MVEQALQHGRNVFLLDVHSFPNTIESFGVDSHTKSIPHVVVLDYQHRHDYVVLPHTTVLPASRVNDVTVQAIGAGADALLLEFNEDQTYTPDKYVKAVAMAIGRQLLTSNK
jgi:hypothetical protein